MVRFPEELSRASILRYFLGTMQKLLPKPTLYQLEGDQHKILEFPGLASNQESLYESTIVASKQESNLVEERVLEYQDDRISSI